MFKFQLTDIGSTRLAAGGVMEFPVQYVTVVPHCKTPEHIIDACPLGLLKGGLPRLVSLDERVFVIAKYQLNELFKLLKHHIWLEFGEKTFLDSDHQSRELKYLERDNSTISKCLERQWARLVFLQICIEKLSDVRKLYDKICIHVWFLENSNKWVKFGLRLFLRITFWFIYLQFQEGELLLILGLTNLLYKLNYLNYCKICHLYFICNWD